MTKRFKKILIIVIGVAVLVVLLLAGLAKILITPERIKMALIPRAEKALNRPVKIGDVDIGLFSGITVKNFAVMEKSSEAVFVSADQVSLKYRLWPLLQKHIEIDEVILRQPRIRIERMADGSFNFSDLMTKSKEEETKPPAPGEQEQKRDIDLLISNIEMRRGEIMVVDHAVAEGKEGQAFRYQLREVNLQVEDLSLENKFPWQLEAQLGQAPLELAGTADLANKAIQARMSLTGLDVLPFKPYFAEKIPGQLQSLQVDMTTELAGNAERLAGEGTVRLHNVDLKLEALPQTPINNVDLGIQYSFKLDRPQSLLEIPGTRVTLNGIPMTLAGRITDFPAASKVDLTLNLPELDLRKAMPALPPALAKPLLPLDPAGKLSARVELSGALGDGSKGLRKNGQIRLNDVQADLGGQRSSVTGAINLAGNELSAKNLMAVIGPNQTNIDFQVKNLTEKPFAVTTKLTSDRFNLDALLQKGQGAATQQGGTRQKPQGSRTGTAEEKPIGPFDLPIRLNGTALIDQVLYKGLTINQARARYQLKNNIFTLEELTGNVAGGAFTETARVDLGKKGLEYTSQLKTSNVQLDPLVSAFFPKGAGTIFGGLDLNLDLAGTGTRPATIRQTLTAKGDVLLQNAKVKKRETGLVSGLANFLGLSDLQEMDFQKAEGRFAVDNGKMALNTALEGKQMELFPKGTVGLDGALDLNLGLRLSPPLVNKIGEKFPSMLKDKAGWGQIPLKLAGTVSQPRFTLDTSALKAQAEEQAKEKLQETLQEKLFKKKEKSGENTGEQKKQEPQDQAEKMLKGVFKGLLNN
jgi:AsmA protein